MHRIFNYCQHWIFHILEWEEASHTKYFSSRIHILHLLTTYNTSAQCNIYIVLYNSRPLYFVNHTCTVHTLTHVWKGDLHEIASFSVCVKTGLWDLKHFRYLVCFWLIMMSLAGILIDLVCGLFEILVGILLECLLVLTRQRSKDSHDPNSGHCDAWPDGQIGHHHLTCLDQLDSMEEDPCAILRYAKYPPITL